MTETISLEEADPMWVHAEEEEEESEEKEDLALELAEKARRYINDPADAPEGVQIQEGERGGIYYETESEADRSPSQTPDASFGDVDFTQSNEYGVLPEDEQVKLRNHFADQHGEEVVEDFYGDYGWMNEWKAHRESDEGVKMGIAYARALGLDESNVKSYDESLADEVTEDHVALAEDIHQASKVWFQEKFGNEAQMNRGFKDGGPKMLGTLFADEEDNIDLSGNEMDNWAWNMNSPMEWGRSRSDGIGAIVRTNRDINEVIFTIDGIAGEYPTHNDSAVTFDGDAEVEKENVSLESRGAVKEYEEDGSWDYNWDSYEGSFFPFRPLEEQEMEGIKAFALSAGDDLKFASFPNEEAKGRAKAMLSRVEDYLEQNLNPDDPSDEQILEEFDAENLTRYW